MRQPMEVALSRSRSGLAAPARQDSIQKGGDLVGPVNSIAGRRLFFRAADANGQGFLGQGPEDRLVGRVISAVDWKGPIQAATFTDHIESNRALVDLVRRHDIEHHLALAHVKAVGESTGDFVDALLNLRVPQLWGLPEVDG